MHPASEIHKSIPLESEASLASLSSNETSNQRVFQGHMVTNVKSANIYSLPIDVLLLIQQALSWSDRKSFHETCSSFFKTKERMMMFDQEGCLRRIFRHALNHQPLSGTVLQYVKNVFQKCPKLEFDHISFSENEATLDQKLVSIAMGALTYWGSYVIGLNEQVDSFPAIVHHFQEAKALTINHTDIEGGTLEHAKTLTGLQELTIRSCPYITLDQLKWLSCLKNLHSFEITQCRNLQDWDYEKILQNISREVTALKIGYLRKYCLGRQAPITAYHNRLTRITQEKTCLQEFKNLRILDLTHFYNGANNHDDIPEMIHIFSELEWFAFPRFILSLGNFLKNMSCEKTLKHLNLSELIERNRGGSIEAIEKFIHLEHLNISGTLDDLVSHYTSIGKLISLKTLHLDSCRINDEGVQRLLELENLEVLTLSNCVGLSNRSLRFLTQFPKLQVLNLSCCSSLSSEAFDIDSEFTSLISLDVSGTDFLPGHNITDTVLKKLSTICPNLEHINLTGRASITSAGLEHLVKLKKLKAIELGGCLGIGSDALQILSRIPTLEKIHVWFGAYVEENGIKALEALKNLKELTLEGEFTDNAIKSLVTHKHVQSLHLFGSFELSENMLLEIRCLRNLQHFLLLPVSKHNVNTDLLASSLANSRQEVRNFGLDMEERVCSLSFQKLIELYKISDVQPQQLELDFPQDLHLNSLSIDVNFLSEVGVQKLALLKTVKRTKLLVHGSVSSIAQTLRASPSQLSLACINTDLNRDMLSEIANIRNLVELFCLGFRNLKVWDFFVLEKSKSLEYLLLAKSDVNYGGVPGLSNIAVGHYQM